MAMDRVLADHQPLGDLPVGEPLGEEAQHLALAPRDPGRLWAIAAAERGLEQPAGTLGLRLGPQLEQAIQRRGRLALGQLGSTQGGEARGQLDPRLRGLERRAAPLEAIDGVLEQRPRPLVLAARGLEQSLGQLGGGAQRLGPDQPLDLAQGLERRARLLELAARDPGADQQLERRRAIEPALGGRLAQQPLDQLDRPARLALVERQAGSAELRRRRRPRPIEQQRRLLRPALPAASAPRAPTSGPPTIAGREREKSSTEASSISSASVHRPRQRWTAPYSARQKASM